MVRTLAVDRSSSMPVANTSDAEIPPTMAIDVVRPPIGVGATG